MSTNTTAGTLVEVKPDLLQDWLQRDAAVLIDVREDFEHANERIAAAEHHALDRLDADALRREHRGKRIVFHCRSGKRSARAAADFGGKDGLRFHLSGGIEAWKAAGLPTEQATRRPRIDVMRQVQMTAGTLVLTGVLLGAFVNPWFLLLSGFVGGGLIFAGASGWCGMAKLLARLPWNQAKHATDSVQPAALSEQVGT